MPGFLAVEVTARLARDQTPVLQAEPHSSRWSAMLPDIIRFLQVQLLCAMAADVVDLTPRG